MAIAKSWTKARQETLEKWVLQAKGPLGLSDWTIRHNWEPTEDTVPDEDGHLPAYATMNHHTSSKHATLSVSRELLALSQEEIKSVLVHELTHCYLFPLHEFARESFDAAAEDNKLATSVYAKALNQRIEEATDSLGDALKALAPPLDLS